ncbi:D-alanyl-D-alanine carboxypeptidase [Flavitalea flava]
MKQFFGTSLILTAIFWQGCSPSQSIGKFAKKEITGQSGLQSAQVGISLYDPVAAKFLYDYQGDKFFMPASNTKLFSLYAGMKYLGDSLVGMRYLETDTALFVLPSADPTLLHPDFSKQPVISVLKKTKKNIYLLDANWQEEPLGYGWAWNDYNDDYMPERSSLPVYGNVIRWVQEGQKQEKQESSFEASPSFYSIPDVDWEVRFTTDTGKRSFFVQREWKSNAIEITEGKEKYKVQDVPFITNGLNSAALLLKDTVGKKIMVSHQIPFPGLKPAKGDKNRFYPIMALNASGLITVRSQPVDSLFRPMMHRSDNFFAEQTLLMVSNEKLGVINDEQIIDTLLKTDLKDLPQKPRWVDGSGLSRNDLFTPRDFVWLLNKLKDEFGLTRLKGILPTGGTGTLAKYYKQDSGYIFAKTGSLSGVVALSGYLITKKDRLLLFSVLINNHNDPAVRRKIERLIHLIRDKY